VRPKKQVGPGQKLLFNRSKYKRIPRWRIVPGMSEHLSEAKERSSQLAQRPRSGGPPQAAQ